MRKSFLLSVLLFSTSLGSGFCAFAKSTDVRILEEFTELEVNNGVTVILKKCEKGENPEAKIEVDGIETSSITTKSKGQGTLLISTKAKAEKVELGQKVKKQKANVTIKYKNISKIKLKGASSCIIENEEGLRASDLELVADGGAKFEGSVIVDNEFKITCKSGSKIKLSGKSNKANLECSGTCSVDIQGMEVKEMELNATTGSTVKVSVSNSFKGTINSLAKLFVFGEPKKFELSRGSLALVKFSNLGDDDSKSSSKKSKKK